MYVFYDTEKLAHGFWSQKAVDWTENVDSKEQSLKGKRSKRSKQLTRCRKLSTVVSSSRQEKMREQDRELQICVDVRAHMGDSSGQYWVSAPAQTQLSTHCSRFKRKLGLQRRRKTRNKTAPKILRYGAETQLPIQMGENKKVASVSVQLLLLGYSHLYTCPSLITEPISQSSDCDAGPSFVQQQLQRRGTVE